jgi:hypothetical protein
LYKTTVFEKSVVGLLPSQVTSHRIKAILLGLLSDLVSAFELFKKSGLSLADDQLASRFYTWFLNSSSVNVAWHNYKVFKFIWQCAQILVANYDKI